MSRPDPIRLLEPQLSQCKRLDWIIYGQPMVAIFSKSGNPHYSAFDREYLGQPSRHNHAGHGLKLWVGFDQETNKLLVTLTHEIQVSSGKKPRIFYLCVSIESLTLETSDPAYWAMSEGVVPLHALDRPENARPDQISRLLHTGFSLGTKSWVIMPDFPHTGRVTEESMSLLRKLKALSQAPTFDLFTTHDSWIHQSLLRVQSVLADHRVTGFNINYANFYPGGRSAVIDRWESQGWRPVEAVVEDDGELEGSVRRKSVKRKRCGTPCDVVAPTEFIPPPPYDLRGSNPIAGGASTASFDMAVILAKEYVDSGEESLLSEIYPRGRSISLPAATRIPKSLTPNFVFTPVVTPDLAGKAISGPTTPLIQDLSSPFHSRAQVESMKNIVTHDSIDTSSSSKHTLPSHRPPQMPCTPERAADTKQPIPLPTYKASPSHIPETPDTQKLSRNRASTGQSTTQRNVLINWLATLLEHHPHTHYVCISELLALGLAITMDNADDVRRWRAKCVVSLLKHTTDKSVASRHEMISDGIQKVENLISWLLVLSPEAGDLMFLDRLTEMISIRNRLAAAVPAAAAGHESTSGIPASPRSSDGVIFNIASANVSVAGLRDELMACEAGIILDACIAFSADISENDGIKDLMMAEMECLS